MMDIRWRSRGVWEDKRKEKICEANKCLKDRYSASRYINVLQQNVTVSVYVYI